MNCFNHSEVPAVAFCRNCGKGLCADCRRVAQGTVFCEEHVPAAAASTVARPAPSPVLADTSPALAFLLGLIPGVGAIYNGQYAKGLVHAIIFGLLVSIDQFGFGRRPGTAVRHPDRRLVHLHGSRGLPHGAANAAPVSRWTSSRASSTSAGRTAASRSERSS